MSSSLINEKWGDDSWTPIVVDADDDYPRSVAALSFCLPFTPLERLGSMHLWTASCVRLDRAADSYERWRAAVGTKGSCRAIQQLSPCYADCVTRAARGTYPSADSSEAEASPRG